MRKGLNVFDTPYWPAVHVCKLAGIFTITVAWPFSNSHSAPRRPFNLFCSVIAGTTDRDETLCDHPVCMYVSLSDITDITSGVPQGSVLGPVLFLLYTNDIDANIKSIRLFADDSIIYRHISSKTDHRILQTDLNQPQTWSVKRQMEFNVSKCVHLPIRNKTKPSPHKYSLFGQLLSTVSSHSYLGVKLDSKL